MPPCPRREKRSAAPGAATVSASAFPPDGAARPGGVAFLHGLWLGCAAPARGIAMNTRLLAMLCAASGTAFAQADQAVVLEGARLIDGTGKAPRENSVIVVQGDRITAVGVAGKLKVPKGARVVDVRGRTIMPGLINAHGHVGLVANGKNSADAYTRENILAQLAQYEQYGVTAIMALGLNRDLGYDIRDEQRKGGVPGASLFVAGRGIGVPD